MKKVLFVCVHNAARSQMAEAFLNRLGEGLFIAESAGLEPGVLNPDIIDVMREIGYDISQNKTKSVFDFYKEGKRFHYVVKVCDQINGQKCPIFPSTIKVLDWNHEDPAEFKGGKEERLAQARELRDSILRNIQEMIDRERILNIDYKLLESKKLDVIQSVDEISLNIEHILLEVDHEKVYGVKNSMFDNPRFQLESITSSSVANWLFIQFGQSILRKYEWETFKRTHYVGLLNSLVNSMTFSLSDIGLNLTECLHEYLNKYGLNINTQYRSFRHPENLNLSDWKEFTTKSILEGVPLIIANHSESYLVYGFDSVNSDFLILKDGVKSKLNLEHWGSQTNQACIVKVLIES